MPLNPETTSSLFPIALSMALLLYCVLAVLAATLVVVALVPRWRAGLRRWLARVLRVSQNAPASPALPVPVAQAEAGKNGASEGIVLGQRELPEAAQLRLKLEAARARFEQLDAVKTDFITIASHELRTPLAQVRGYIDILDALNEADALDTDKTAQMVGNLRRASERMEELISDMLDVSQIGVNAMDLRFTPTALESAMRIAIEPLTEAIRGRKLTLTARGLKALPQIEADTQRLVQAFRALIGNAIKFTPDGGRIEITGSLAPNPEGGQSQYVMIAITDTGVGIHTRNLDLIFEKFFRAYDPAFHSTGAHKFMGAGPGLGLTIARGVIEGHGGEVWAESSGHDMQALPGSTFYIMLPLTPPETARRTTALRPADEPTRPKLRQKL